MEERQLPRVVRTIMFDPVEFATSLLRSSERMLSICRERNWWSNDADLLEASAMTLMANATLPA